MGASIKICYVMLCYVMLCYVMLCYVMLTREDCENVIKTRYQSSTLRLFYVVRSILDSISYKDKKLGQKAIFLV